MREILLSQGKVALVDDDMFEEMNRFKWHAKANQNGNYYAVRTKYENGIKTCIRMHRVILKLTNPEILVDHIDGNSLNNQRCNLRECNNSQNQMNRLSTKNSKSSYVGVTIFQKKSKDKIYKYWYAQLVINGIYVLRKCFKTEIEAAKAYDEAAKIHHKDFARLNFPESNSLTPQTNVI